MTMHVARDGIELCTDCMFRAVNGDLPSDTTPERDAEIDAGLESLGPHLVPSFDTETGEGYEAFTWRRCDCCGSKLGGSRYEFAVLALGPAPEPRGYAPGEAAAIVAAWKNR